MELWGEDAEFRGAVCPVFYSRSGEVLEMPSECWMPPLSCAASEFCAEINVLQFEPNTELTFP
jgi:hypothetical protein